MRAKDIIEELEHEIHILKTDQNIEEVATRLKRVAIKLDNDKHGMSIQRLLIHEWGQVELRRYL